LHVEAASAAAVASPTAWTFERTAAERASFYGRQTHMASAPLCPECPQHPPLVKEATEFLCHSCGYIQNAVQYGYPEDFRDADQNWNGLAQEEVRVLRDFNGRTVAGLGVDTSRKDLRRKQQVSAMMGFIKFVCSSPAALHHPRYTIHAQGLFERARVNAGVNRTLGEAAKYVAAACVMLAVKEKGARVTVQEMSVYANLEPQRLQRALRSTALELGMHRFLPVDPEQHIDQMIGHLQLLSEDPVGNRRASKHPFNPKVLAYLSRVFPKLGELRACAMHVNALAERAGIFTSRMGTASMVAIVYAALQAIAGEYLFRADGIVEELAACMDAASFTSRERFRELRTLVLDLAEALPLIGKCKAVPSVDSRWKGKNRAIPSQAFFVYILPDVVRYREELIAVRFGTAGSEFGPSPPPETPAIAPASTLAKRRTRHMGASTCPSVSAAEEESGTPPTVSESSFDQDRPSKRLRLHGSSTVAGKSVVSAIDSAVDENASDGSDYLGDAAVNTSSTRRPTNSVTPLEPSIGASSIDSRPTSQSQVIGDRPPHPSAPVWPEPGSAPPGEGWQTSTPWRDPRLPPETFKPLETSVRVKSARARATEQVNDGKVRDGLFRKIYQRYRPSDSLREGRKARRRPAAVAALLRQWQTDHKEDMVPLATIPSQSDSRLEREATALKGLLRQGVKPSHIPLGIFPQSKTLARLMLRDCLQNDLDDDSLFEEGEMEDYLATEEQKKVFLAHWAGEGLEAAHLKVQQSQKGVTNHGSEVANGRGRGKSKASSSRANQMRNLRSLIDQPDGLQGFLDELELETLQAAESEQPFPVHASGNSPSPGQPDDEDEDNDEEGDDASYDD